MPPTDPRNLTPEGTLEFMLSAWTVDLHAEVSRYRENPQAQWQYSEEQYSRKLWMHAWRDRDVPPHLKSLFDLDYTTDKLLERWKEGRGNEAQSRDVQERLWGMIDSNTSKVPSEMAKVVEHARSQLGPEEDAVLSLTPQQQREEMAQGVQQLEELQQNIRDPLLREQIAAKKSVLNLGAANAPSASGITTTGRPAPSQRDDSTDIPSALSGLRGAFTAGGRRARPESVQEASGAQSASGTQPTGPGVEERRTLIREDRSRSRERDRVRDQERGGQEGNGLG